MSSMLRLGGLTLLFQDYSKKSCWPREAGRLVEGWRMEPREFMED